MNVSLYQAAAAMNASTRWQDLVAQNLAAGSIPGYKKQDLSFASVAAGVMPSPATSPGAAPHFALPRATSATNFQPGELRHTGVNTDVAIEGPGFFEVRLPNGATAYTRDGEFQINAAGQLVTKSGLPIMGDGGMIQIDRHNPDPLSISATGEVSQGPNRLGRIQVIGFSDPQMLTPTGGGLFLARGTGLAGSALPEPSLRQGFLEAANTSPVIEMSNLITAMRTFESGQRVIQMHDERMGRAISELGNPA